jgi:hypothetical protein
VEECRPCPVFASFTLAFALQLRKITEKPQSGKEKTPVRLRRTSVRVQFVYQNTCTLQNPHKHTHYKTLTNTHITKPSQTPAHYKTLTSTHVTKPTHIKTLMTNSISSVGARLQVYTKIGHSGFLLTYPNSWTREAAFLNLWPVFSKSTVRATALKNTRDTGYGLIASLCSISS